MVYIPEIGEDIPEGKFEQIKRICYRYLTRRISGAEFERLMRNLGYSRAKAYQIYRYVISVIKWVNVLVSASLVTTSTKGAWSQRYFEGRIFAPVPDELRYDVPGGVVEPVMRCSDIEDLSDFFMACLFMYFESKGYDVEMLETAEWKAGVKYLDEFYDSPDIEIVFKCEIYDMGSANRPMNIKRWADDIEVIRRYWENLEEACRVFRENAFKVGYLKSMGKQVRW